MSRAETKRVEPHVKDKKKEQETMSGAFICINPFNILHKIVGTLLFSLESEKTETRAEFSEMCPLSFSPLSHFFVLCYTILCYDKSLLSSMWQRPQRSFPSSLPSPVGYRTLIWPLSFEALSVISFTTTQHLWKLCARNAQQHLVTSNAMANTSLWWGRWLP